MIDRLPDFIRIVKRKEISLDPPKNFSTSVSSSEMFEFTKQVGKGNLIIKSLNDETEKLKEIRDKIKNAIGDKESQLKIETDNCLETLNSLRKKGKEVADEMKVISERRKETLNSEAIEKGDIEFGNTEIRVINNLNGSYITNFKKVVSASETVESDVKIVLQKKLLRGVGVILGRDPNNEEAREYLESPEKYQQLLENKLTQGQAHTVLKNKVKDLESRHKEILQLENVNILFFI
jgi:hypothetical protein